MTRAWSTRRVVAVLALALFIRFIMFAFVSPDLDEWVLYWFDYLNQHGLVALGGPLPNEHGFEQIEGNYTPAYYYLLWFATLFDHLVPKLYLVKLVSVAFDFVAATFMYRIVAATTTAVSPWTGFFAVLFAPTVLLNSSLWGQCDVIPQSFVLGCLYFTIVRRPWTAMLCIGVAVSVKATAVFLFPYLLILMLRRWLPRWTVAVIPVAYAIIMAPAAILGRPVSELATVYFTQARFFDRLSMDSPNLYHFMSNEYYATVAVVGIGVTAIACLGYAALPMRAPRIELTPRFLILAATLSVAMVPFLLPKMHDRYFFAADLLSIALVLNDRRLWPVAVGFQLSSTLAYLPVMSHSWEWHWLDPLTRLFPVAVLLNCLLVGYLALHYVRSARLGTGELAPFSSA